MSRNDDRSRKEQSALNLENRQRLLILWNEQKGKCFYCNKPAELDGFYYGSAFMSNAPRKFKASRDHIIPVCRGGKDELENLVMSCRECNEIKGSLTGEEYLYVKLWGCDAEALAAYANIQYQLVKDQTPQTVIFVRICKVAAEEKMINKNRYRFYRKIMVEEQKEVISDIIRDIENLEHYDQRTRTFKALRKAIRCTPFPPISPERLARLT